MGTDPMRGSRYSLARLPNPENPMHLRRFLLLLAVATFATATAADARVHRVREGQSIQAAIDRARPGDTILVDAGTYQEPGATYGLRISTPNLRLIGRTRRGRGHERKVRVLHSGTQETGIYAAPEGCEYKDSACAGELEGFYLRGFTVEGFPVNGIQTRWVKGFKFIRNESIDNLNNGIYPTLSAHGLVANNFSYGSLDTALWVAGSSDVRVIGNELTGAPTGLEITVANDVLAIFNNIHDNTVGVGLYHPNAAGNPQMPEMKDWVIAFNWIHDNNLPNPAPPGSFQEGLPPGNGVLLLGVSDHVVARNWIQNNDGAGIGVLGWCTAVALGDPARNCNNSPPQADPASNNNLIFHNWLRDNGANPAPIGLPGVDILYVQFEPASGNCFEKNKPEDFTFFTTELNGELPSDGC